MPAPNELPTYDGVPELELHPAIYQTEIQPHLRPGISLAELTEHTTPGHIITTMHLWPDQQQADAMWVQEIQPMYAKFWQQEYELRSKFYEDAIGWLGIRKKFAEKSAIHPKTLVLDIGGGNGAGIPSYIDAAKEPIGIIIVENNPLAQHDAEDRFRQLSGSLFHASLRQEDFTTGLLGSLAEEIAGVRVRPSNLAVVSFYSATYQPAKFIRRAVDEVFELGRQTGLETSMTIWATNPMFDTRIIAAELPKYAAQLTNELGDAAGPIIERVKTALSFVVPHGGRVKTNMFGYPEGIYGPLLNSQGRTVTTESMLNGHSTFISITESNG
jgi:hypothetical protein